MNFPLTFDDDEYDYIEKELAEERIREEVEVIEEFSNSIFTSSDVIGRYFSLEEHMYENNRAGEGVENIHTSDEETETYVKNDEDVIPSEFYDVFTSEDVNCIDFDFTDGQYDIGDHDFQVEEEDDTLSLYQSRIQRAQLLLDVVSGRGKFQIVTFVNEHNCTVARLNLDHRRCTATFVANHIKEHLLGNEKINSSFVISEIRKVFRVRISYKKAYNALQISLVSVRGDYDQCYKDLPAYLRELRIHDFESKVKLMSCSSTHHFRRVFWAFGASLRGFREYMHPILCINATHLRGKYPGVLMIATSIDAENRLFPVAFAVIEIEKIKSWEWFLDELFRCIPGYRGLSIMSDRNLGIIAAVRNVFPNAAHGYCMVHLVKNLVHDVRSKDVVPLFWAAARSTTKHSFNECMQKILAIHEQS
ncbi:hypothetical protein Cni_G09939 [Canna indica]|uniref:MULE transposase domain-containing protein n=1 Tax=Canna indica TaxID=4628 RepID=A0AAQ3K3E2_9LILI|nr:hypothetical protein Cni_G09939 [Canna indica]